MRTRTPFLLLLGLSALSASAATFVTGGTVSGPTTSTDNAIVRFDGTTGRTIQSSGATLDDNGTVTLTGAGSATLGLLSLPSGTTKNQGIAFGTNPYLYRLSDGCIAMDDPATNSARFAFRTGAVTKGSILVDSSGIFYIYTNGTTEAARFDSSQNATFAGNAKAASGLSVNGTVTAAGTGANYSVIDNNGTFRLLSYGQDTSTNGAFSFLSLRSNGSNTITPLSWTSGAFVLNAGATTSALTDLLINPTTKTSGNLFDAQVGGVSKFKISSSGAIIGQSASDGGIVFNNDINGYTTINWASNNCGFGLVAGGGIRVRLAGTSLLTFNAETSSAVGLKPSGTTLKVRLADDSGDAALTASTGTFSGLVVVGGSTPASASATGTAGTVTWDSSYIYICTATNTWKRAAIATW